MTETKWKVCKTCGENKPFDDIYYPVEGSGHRAHCRVCYNAKQRVKAGARREKMGASSRQDGAEVIPQSRIEQSKINRLWRAA